MRVETPKRSAIFSRAMPSSVRRRKAVTWSTGCIPTRTSFSARLISMSLADSSRMRQGTIMSGWTLPSSASSRIALKRRLPAMTS